MVAIVVVIVLHIFSVLAQNCPFQGYESHQLEVSESYSFSLINSSTPGLYLNESKYGVEGGQVLLVDNTFYLVITEFTGDPLWVPSNLAVWSTTMDTFPFGWKRIAQLYQSGGICDCNESDYRASLGSSITAAYNQTSQFWILYYVGFQSCQNGSGYFYNQNGRIFMAQSTIKGPNGIVGPYKDIKVIMKPDENSEPWEGLQGVDSFSNPYKATDGKYYAFYGSALTQDTPCCNQRVGLAMSENDLYGPWIREPYPSVNPSNLTIPNNSSEQPIVTRFLDGTYGAVWNTLNKQGQGMVGYVWSPDGINWRPECSQYLAVNPQNGTHWGQARTPQGLIPINGSDSEYYLFFSGHDGGDKHESFGYSKVKFKTN